MYHLTHLNKMKKSTLLLSLALLMTMGLTSCHKEKAGVYQPKKQIQKLYYSSPREDKTPLQSWEWEHASGNDRLRSITHHEFFMKNDNWVENFSYDNGRLNRVDNYANEEYITYEFADDQLRNALHFYRNKPMSSWQISCEEGKITKIIGDIYEGYKSNAARLTLDPLQGLLPYEALQQVAKKEQKMAAERNGNGTLTLVLLLKWNGEQLEKITATGNGDYMDFILQYDDKNNPYYGFLGGLEDTYQNFVLGHIGFTKNNVKQMTIIEDDYADTIRYAYQYDRDGYPILQTMYYADEPDDKMVLYFEY